MSTYDNNTGWSHFSPTKVKRYYRTLENEPQYVEDRLKKNEIEFYFDSYGGLHALCTPGELWTILSGEPSTWDDPKASKSEPEYLTVTDIGNNLTPEKTGRQVNLILQKLKMHKRIDKEWVLQDAGKEWGMKFASTSERFDKPFLKWRFETIAHLQKHLDESNPT